MKHIDDLRDVIRKLHGVASTRRESVPVTETWQGKLIWQGVVEVFTLHGHPETETAYAWSHDTDGGSKRHVTVLHVHPATTPIQAVRAALLQEYRDANPA